MNDILSSFLWLAFLSGYLWSMNGFKILAETFGIKKSKKRRS